MIVENTDGKPVRGLQSMLRNISYYVEDIPMIIPDGNFDDKTKESVISFQRIYGLEPTGEADNITWQKIRDVNNEINKIYVQPGMFPVFGKRIIINAGDEIPELLVLQAVIYVLLLRYPNAPVIEITGIHDDKSVESVIFLQNISGLEPTGVIDTPTYNMIIELYNSNVARKIE